MTVLTIIETTLEKLKTDGLVVPPDSRIVRIIMQPGTTTVPRVVVFVTTGEAEEFSKTMSKGIALALPAIFKAIKDLQELMADATLEWDVPREDGDDV